MRSQLAATNLTLPWEEDQGDFDLRQLIADVEWSYSRRGVLEQCPRRYYYEYYAARAMDSGPEKGLLKGLKSLQTRHERIGVIAHLVIGTYFRKAQVGGAWTADRVVSWARDIWLKDLSHSRASSNGRPPNAERFPPVTLHEYYHNHPDAAASCSEAEKRLLGALSNFMGSPVFEEFRQAGTRPDSLIECHLTLGGIGCRVSGRLDLAFPSNAGAVVVDWKLGDPSGEGEDSLQLATYALWAAQRFGCEPLAVTVCKAYLVPAQIAFFTPMASTFANARSRILQDAERIAVLHDYGRRGVARAFTPCTQRRICGLCPFQEICPEGRVAAHVGN